MRNIKHWISELHRYTTMITVVQLKTVKGIKKQKKSFTEKNKVIKKYK